MRCTAGSQCEDLTRERDGWDALSGRNARAVERTIAGDQFWEIERPGRRAACPVRWPVPGPLSTQEFGVGDRSLPISIVIGYLRLLVDTSTPDLVVPQTSTQCHADMA